MKTTSPDLNTIVADPPAPASGAPPGPARTMGSCVQPCPLVGPPPPTDANFREKFLTWTGMSVEQSIAIYQQQTGKSLTEDQVQRLFIDPAYAKQQLMADADLHHVFRSILNTNVPATREMAIAQGFHKMTIVGTWYHNPLENTKYIGPDGHLEAVYNSEGNLVTDTKYLGTFNFYEPPAAWQFGWSDESAAHKAADVDPYKKWGN